jgi:small subunit ribosomal protein S6
MRDYELMTIHRPDLAEDEVETKIGELEAFLANSDAEVTKRDLWGKRRFAYEIEHLSEGYYSVLSFRSGAEAIAEVDRMLSLADEVVRHKIVRLGD